MEASSDRKLKELLKRRKEMKANGEDCVDIEKDIVANGEAGLNPIEKIHREQDSVRRNARKKAIAKLASKKEKKS